MEIFVEQNEVPPVRIGLEFFDASIDRPAAVLVAKEDAGKAARQLAGYIPEIHHPPRARRKLDLKAVSGIVVEFLESLDQQEIDRKPDRPAPVGIAAEQPRSGFGGLIIHGLLVPIDR